MRLSIINSEFRQEKDCLSNMILKSMKENDRNCHNFEKF